MIPLKDNIPTRSFPVVTVALIVANVVVFVFFQHALFGPHGGFNSSGDPERTVEYSFIPYELSHYPKECDLEARAADGNLVNSPEGVPLCEGTVVPTVAGPERIVSVVHKNQPPVFLTILTSMFMHGGILHIAGNMLFLWIFGNNVEDSMGRLKFALFYLVGGIIAALTHFAFEPSSTAPTLGASGAIAAVLGGYAVLYPRARVVTLIFIIFFVTVIELPALLVLGVWFALQLLDVTSQSVGGGGGGVAYFAHIGGFVFGLLTVKLLATRYNPNYDSRPRTPVY